MANLVMTEAPGGIGDAYQCPTCGRMYLAVLVDEQGNITNTPVDAPRQCRRCSSPMDLEAAQKFQDEQAIEAAKPADRAVVRRRTVKV